MFENITFESIMEDMLTRVRVENPNIDTREGSIIWTALAPAAAELQQLYIALDAVLNEGFADTASREYLIKRAAERGLTPEPATKAVMKGVFNIDVPIGSRFSFDDLNYVATEKIDIGQFMLECETAGLAGNSAIGTIIPVEYIDGLTSAEITEVLIPAQDEENTELFRQRYFDDLGSQSFGGNISDYKERVNLLDGVGGLKVIPVWNGGGTVKLIIIDSIYGVPTPTLIDAVQTSVDPIANSGQGLGIAPIGHVVTVEGVVATTVNVTASITYQSGWSWAEIEPYVQTSIDEYFLELSQSWAESDQLIVRISRIELLILDIEGVVDVSGVQINSVASNLVLDSNAIPSRGVISDGT